MNSKKITFIGSLDLEDLPSGGNTVKNRILLDYIAANYSDINFIDTSPWKKSLTVLWKLFLEFFIYRDRILILSICTDSADRISKILYRIKRKEKMYYFAVGGGFAEKIVSRKYSSKYYTQYNLIFVQGRTMQRKLKDFGLNNVQYLPNFKNFDKSLIDNNQFIASKNSKFHFVFLSRINEKKGVSLIMDAASRLNNEGFTDHYDITFFGPISSDFKAIFQRSLTNFKNIKYEGYLDLDSNTGYKRLAAFDLMLFPTFWEGEGFPGVLVDALISGLPVLASDWNLNKEIIIDNKTGYIIKAKDASALYAKMKHILFNNDEIVWMRTNCLHKAIDYHSDTVLREIKL